MKNNRERLLEHQYSSRKLTVEEVNKVEKADFECEICGKSIFEISDFPETEYIDDYNCICEECYDNEYRSICSCCGESYEKREETHKYLVFTKDNFEEARVEKPGIYKVKNNPYFRSNYFSANAINDNIELVRECDINSMLSNIYEEKTEIETADHICETCAEKYAMITNLNEVSVNYANKNYRIHQNINVKGIIQRGF